MDGVTASRLPDGREVDDGAAIPANHIAAILVITLMPANRTGIEAGAHGAGGVENRDQPHFRARHVNDDCVGCGVCGEVAHAARLCPSFAQIDVIQNPNAWDRLQRGVAAALIRLFGGGRGTQTEAVATEP